MIPSILHLYQCTEKESYKKFHLWRIDMDSKEPVTLKVTPGQYVRNIYIFFILLSI